MSCIAGVLRRDGAPADPRWVEAMLARMHGRAPDGDEVLCDGPLALGHAWLRVDGAARSAAQPIRADGTLWITADARVDGRGELLDALRAAGHPVDAGTPHAGLIALAWRAWGPRMLERLVGDFAFALWDTRTRTLVCARDHFGVRPLHYVETPELFAFASDLDALRVLPQLSDALDDASVADFLIFGTCLDPTRTIWRDARCLPPAHMLRVTDRAATPTRYWDVPEPEPIRLRGRGEYLEAFMQVFTQAVTDRLPDGPVATHLSGGMDSTAIAAVAGDHARRTGHPLTAHHLSCHDLLPEDEERHYTEMVAAHLGLALDCDELGRYPLYARCDDPVLATAMPLVYPHLAQHHDFTSRIAGGGARVLLTGSGGDAVLTPSATYYGDLLRSGRWGALAREIAHHARHTGSLAGMGLRSALLRRPASAVWMPPPPDWIDPDFASRVNFQARWDHAWKSYHGSIDARHQLRQTWVSRSLQSAEVLKLPVVARHPFHDVRLVHFLLGLPNFMLVGKHVLREAMRGRLPERVRIRPKTSLVVDPVRKLVTDGKLAQVARPRSRDPGRDYVRWDLHEEAFRRYRDGEGSDSTWNNVLILAPLALRNWLIQQEKGMAT